jgi:hypothetical protein
MLDTKLISVVSVILLLVAGAVYLFYTHIYKDLINLKNNYINLKTKVDSITDADYDQCVAKDIFSNILKKQEDNDNEKISEINSDEEESDEEESEENKDVRELERILKEEENKQEVAL